MGKRLPIVEAWLNNHWDQVLKIADQTPCDDEYWRAYQALKYGYLVELGEVSSSQSRSYFESALNPPPADHDLHLFALRALAHTLIYNNEMDQAEQCIRTIESLPIQDKERQILNSCSLRWSMAKAMDDYPAQLAAVHRALPAIESSKLFRIAFFRIKRLEAAIENHDFPQAQADIDFFRSEGIDMSTLQALALPIIEAQLHFTMGNHEQALHKIDQLTSEEFQSGPVWVRKIRIQSLIYLSKMKQAQECLDRMNEQVDTAPGASSSRTIQSQLGLTLMQAQIALGQGETTKAWQLADDIIEQASKDHPNWQREGRLILLEALLNEGRVMLAQRVLDRVDPTADRFRYHVLRLRLHCLQAQHDQAIELLSQVLSKMHPRYPKYLSAQLRFAGELSSSQLASLYHQAMQRLNLSNDSADSHSVDQDGKRTTLARRDQILKLFRQHRRLTRAQVIQLIGCAPIQPPVTWRRSKRKA